MKRCHLLAMVVIVALLSTMGCRSVRLARLYPAQRGVRRISADTYIDKMKGGWVGQMAGVGWGAPTEFRYQGVIMPESDVPRWSPRMVNQFDQDDLYVEMTFLRTLEVHGFGVSIRQAGIDFANSRYPLWHANAAARDNLRRGIAPPDSGHPHFNKHADDIDYQIEADFSGLIAPGMPNVAIQLGEKFGRLMNYGDGLYGGQFVGGMYAEAFFEDDMVKVVQAGLRCIPASSQYHQCISDVLRWYKEYPDDWTRTWHLVNEKYHLNPDYRRFSCTGPEDPFNIDAKINGAYVVMGLLYGRGDPDRTIIIAMRCGQDSDCNPSTAAGILFTSIGFANLPEKFKIALNPLTKFSHTSYDFPTLIGVCDELARRAVINSGGHIQIRADGSEVYVIPNRRPRPSRLERSWKPGRPDDSRFSEAEMAQITALLGVDLSEDIDAFAPGWTVARCGDHVEVGLLDWVRGRNKVLVTHPLNPETGCVISRTVQLPASGSKLRLVVGHDPRGDWDLIVRINGEQLLRKSVGLGTTSVGWKEVAVDLSDYAGQSVKIELVNEPTGWHYEGGHWAEISLQAD